MKAIKLCVIGIFISLNLIAKGKDPKVINNEPLREGKYVLLDYKEHIELLGNKDSLFFVALTEGNIKELNNLIVDYITKKNSIIDSEVKVKIQKSPHNSELIKNSLYISEATSYFYQLFPTVNSKGQKLVWINGIHRSLMKNKDLNKLTIIADGSRNLNFGFWVNLISQ